jgi:tRNA (guanine9-N1)-methyltransferase
MSGQEVLADDFLAKTESQDASLFTDNTEPAAPDKQRTRMNKTERKFKKYQNKLAKYKLKKLEKKKQRQEAAARSDPAQSDSESAEVKRPRIDQDRAANSTFISKRDAKKMTMERLNAAYDPQTDLSSYLKVLIDCSFSDKMSSKEQSRLAQQIGRCYATNKSLEKPVHLTLCNLNTDSKFYAELARVNYGFENYIMKKTEQRVEELNKDRLADLVYLSPDATEYLEDVDSEKIYIIGGLVDETVNKKVS